MYTIKYNRTTNHIAGLMIRDTSKGEERDGIVQDYSQNACGSLTRYRFADGSSHESLTEALAAARIAGQRKLCKTCEKAAEAEIAAAEAEAEESATTSDDDAETTREKTSTVFRYLTKRNANTGRFTELWESCGLDSVERFREDATRKLGDRTEVSGSALRGADWHELYEWFTNNGEKEETMPPKKKTAEKPAAKNPKDATNMDVDEMISAVHATIDQIKAIEPGSEGAETQANELSAEAEEKIRQLPTAKRNPLRGAVKEAREAVAAPKEEEPKGEIVRRAEDPMEIEGVRQLVDMGAEKVREGVQFGLKLSEAGEAVAQIQLDMRTRITNPDTGLPDLKADRKTTKNAAALIYSEAKKDVPEDDVTTLDAHDRLVKATQNKISDVLVDWLRALDSPESADAFKELFPAAAEVVEKGEMESPTEAVYALYESKGVTLPRKGRTELERERRKAAALDKTRKALEVAKERKEEGDLDDAEEAQIDAEIKELSEREKELSAEVPEEAQEPRPEKTPKQKAEDKAERAEKLLTAVTKTVGKLEGAERQELSTQVVKLGSTLITGIASHAEKMTDDEKADLKSQLNELVSNLAAEAAKL